MYNAPHKFGRGASARGGSNGGAKRKSFPPPPRHHSTPTTRLSLGGSGSGSNSRSRTPSAAPPQQAADESFRLVSGPLSLAAIIRLVPDLVDDIRRLEAQGGAAKIKFDSNPNNPANVIDVGGKEYHFTWLDEKDCDIYEERQGGEDGNGLLVETGYAWRKLTIKRVLDESTKKQVNKRTKECEKTQKSRQTIPLEPGSQAMKSQVNKLATVEASPWKHKQKKDSQFQKRNFEPPQAAALDKPVRRPGLSSTTPAKGRFSTSPLPSPQNQYISFASPSARGSTAAESRTIYDPTTTEARAKENTSSPDKISSPLVTSRIHEGAPHKDNQRAGPLDTQHLLITLLKDNSKGMSLKALEKAVGDKSTPSSVSRIEPILKKIATYEPPGKYILKPGVEFGNMKSSPEDNPQKQMVSKNIYGGVPTPDSGFTEKSPTQEMNNNFGESNVVENFDPSQHLTDLFGDDEAPDHNEAQAASSSNSDTDSASSGSGTNSGSQSRSRSKSPAGSASGSGSDNEANSPSNSKETSDVEVDIMSDDDKEPKKLQDKGHGLSEPLGSWSMPEARAGNDDQDDYASEDVDIENDFLGDDEADKAAVSHDLGISSGNIRVVSHDHDQRPNNGLTNMAHERESDEDKFNNEHSGSILHSENKSKRSSSVAQMEQNTDNIKRLKGRSLAQPSDTRNVDRHDSHRSQISDRLNQNDSVNENIGEERGSNYHVPGKFPNAESLQSGRRPPVRPHTTNNADRLAKNRWLDSKDQEMNAHAHEDFLRQGDTDGIEAQDAEGSSYEKGNGKFKESPIGQKSSMRPEPLIKQDTARNKKSNDSSTRRHFGSSPKDTSKAGYDKSPSKGRRLQRELSDLEMGEFREPLAGESEISKKPFERMGSFKKLEAKIGTGSRNTDSNANIANQATLDPGNASSPNLRAVPRKPDSLSKRRSPEPFVGDVVRLQRGIQSQQQQSRSVRVETELLSDKAVNLNRPEYEETFANQGMDVEGYGESQRKSYDMASREDSQQELESHKRKGNKSRKSKAMGNGEDKKRDVSVGHIDKRKTNESSSDENDIYLKYEKDEPELKGPIKNFSQYKEYVQDYRDKYDSYSSLNRILEKYRNEFQKLGLDLESAKGRDMERYYGIVAQLRKSYLQCGTRHKRLKKIFIVLHEELKDLKQRIKDFASDYMRD